MPLHSNVLPGAVLRGGTDRNTHPAQMALCLLRKDRCSDTCLSVSLLLAQILARQLSAQGEKLI